MTIKMQDNKKEAESRLTSKQRSLLRDSDKPQNKITELIPKHLHRSDDFNHLRSHLMEQNP